MWKTRPVPTSFPREGMGFPFFGLFSPRVPLTLCVNIWAGLEKLEKRRRANHVRRFFLRGQGRIVLAILAGLEVVRKWMSM